MFDSIYFKCKDCGEEIEAQSKSGDCILSKYNHDSVPADVAIDANRHAPFLCLCGSKYRFEDEGEKMVSLKIIKML